jgi:hypothetical protein
LSNRIFAGFDVIVAGMQAPRDRRLRDRYRPGPSLGEQEVVDLLTATLEEEKQTDLKLTEVTEQAIMPAAMEEGAEEAPRVRSRAGQAAVPGPAIKSSVRAQTRPSTRFGESVDSSGTHVTISSSRPMKVPQW